jgi:hypothetical protein
MTVLSGLMGTSDLIGTSDLMGMGFTMSNSLRLLELSLVSESPLWVLDCIQQHDEP